MDLRKAKTIIPKSEIEKDVEFEQDQELESLTYKGQDLEDGLSWKTLEYEKYEKSTLWYLIAGLLILGIAVYGVMTDSPIMSITFILIGVVGYVYLQKDPEETEFEINYDGVRAGREMYEYENIKSFWIFYDPPYTKVLSIHTNASMMPFVHIPIGDEDPNVVREILMKYIPEVKQEPSWADSLARFLHI